MMNLILLIRLLWAPRPRSAEAVKTSPVKPGLGSPKRRGSCAMECNVAQFPHREVYQFDSRESLGLSDAERDQIAAAEAWIRAMEDFDRF